MGKTSFLLLYAVPLVGRGTVQRIATYPTSGGGIAISTNGHFLALDDYSEVAIWDLDADRLLDRLPARVNAFPSPENIGLGGTLSFSPDGRFLAMGTGYRGGNDGVRSDVKVWDMATRQEIRSPLFESDDGISGVTFTPDSGLLVATNRSGTLRIWNTSTWELEETLHGGLDTICLDGSPDGRWLVQGGYGGVVIWDFQRREELHVLRNEPAVAVEFSRDGRTLIVSRSDGKLTMWDVETGSLLMTINTGSDVLLGCKVSTDDQHLAVASDQANLWQWDVASIEEIDQHPLTLSALMQQGKNQTWRVPDKPPPVNGDPPIPGEFLEFQTE